MIWYFTFHIWFLWQLSTDIGLTFRLVFWFLFWFGCNHFELVNNESNCDRMDNDEEDEYIGEEVDLGERVLLYHVLSDHLNWISNHERKESGNGSRETTEVTVLAE